MPMISEAERQSLRQRFEERLRDEVTIKLFTQSAARSLRSYRAARTARTASRPRSWPRSLWSYRLC